MMVRCASGARNGSFRLPRRKSGAGAPASRGRSFPFQTTVGRRFGSGRPGRRGRRPGGSRGAAAWSLGLWGTHPSMAENGPSRRCSTPFRCPGGRVWGEGGGWRARGGRGVCLRRSGGLKRASVSRHTSLYLDRARELKNRTPPCPKLPPSLRTFLGSLKSRQKALGTASPPPGTPGARNGRAADSGARTRRGGGRA